MVIFSHTDIVWKIACQKEALFGLIKSTFNLLIRSSTSIRWNLNYLSPSNNHAVGYPSDDNGNGDVDDVDCANAMLNIHLLPE